MKRVDLRNGIIPTTIENTDKYQKKGNENFNTTDLIYLDSYNEQDDGKKTDKERRISATDYAQMNNAYMYDDYTTRTGRQTTWAWLRSACTRDHVYSVSGDRGWRIKTTRSRDAGLCPSLHYHLQSEELEPIDIREVKALDRRNDISYITNW